MSPADCYQLMTTYHHVIEMKGHLIFESNNPNFRAALSGYLNNVEGDGIQMQIANVHDRSQREDIVVQMQLLRMRQHPMDNVVPPGSGPKRIKPAKVKATDSDKVFY